MLSFNSIEVIYFYDNYLPVYSLYPPRRARRIGSGDPLILLLSNKFINDISCFITQHSTFKNKIFIWSSFTWREGERERWNADNRSSFV